MEGALEMPALGRPFRLGRLYDCRRDALIPNVTLWNPDRLETWFKTQDRTGMDCRVLPSESLQSKACALGLGGPLKASFLGGLFEVGGAAAYLEETPPSARDARVALHHSVTTKRKFLPMDRLYGETDRYQEVSDDGSATHVVTALLYGAQAFFVFNCGVSESEDVLDVRRHLLEMVEKFPKVAAEGSDAPQWSDAEKEMEGKIRLTLYGDLPSENASNFREALDVYATTSQTSRDHKKWVPVKVWLYPLVRLAPKAARVVREPPLSWLEEAEAHLQALTTVDLRCQDLIQSPVAALFPQVKDQVKQLRCLCRQHGPVFRQEVGKALLAVRTGREDPAALGAIFTRLLLSPFHRRALKTLLARKTQEVDFVKRCLSHLDGLDVVSAPDKLEDILFDGGNEVVAAFVLTSLDQEEPSLGELRDWLHGNLGGSGTAAPPAKKRKLWFEDEERKCKIRRAVSSFADFAKVPRAKGDVRFLVSSVWDESHPGASVYLYEGGALVNRQLELPSRPAPPKVERVNPASVCISFDPVRVGADFVSGYQVDYRVAGEEWTSLQADASKGRILADVQKNIDYQFRCAAVTPLGIGRWSEIVCFPAAPEPEKEALLPAGRRAEFGPADLGGEGNDVHLPRPWERPPPTLRGRPDVPLRTSLAESVSTAGSFRSGGPELRVFLVGKTGDGKRATGRALLGRKAFCMCLKAGTRRCQHGEWRLNGRKVVVVETPGLGDPRRSEDDIAAELKNGLGLCPPGPHAIIHVLKIGAFAAEERETARLLRETFQARGLRYFILLFTGKEDLEGRPLESFLSAQDEELRKYVAECGHRCLAFGHRAGAAEREAQAEELMRMVQDLAGKNAEAPYYAEETPKSSF